MIFKIRWPIIFVIYTILALTISTSAFSLPIHLTDLTGKTDPTRWFITDEIDILEMKLSHAAVVFAPDKHTFKNLSSPNGYWQIESLEINYDQELSIAGQGDDFVTVSGEIRHVRSPAHTEEKPLGDPFKFSLTVKADGQPDGSNIVSIDPQTFSHPRLPGSKLPPHVDIYVAQLIGLNVVSKGILNEVQFFSGGWELKINAVHTAVPEPSTMLFLGFSLVVLGMSRGRPLKKKSS